MNCGTGGRNGKAKRAGNVGAIVGQVRQVGNVSDVLLKL